MKNKFIKWFGILVSITFIMSTAGVCVAAQESSSTSADNTKSNLRDPIHDSGINTYGVKKKWLDIPYANISPTEKLDIYLPNKGKGPFPVIVAIHGGAFMFGDKQSGQVNDEMAGLTRGYAVVSVNYRLSGEAQFPSAIYDVKAAIRFIKAHAAEYNLNPNKIAAWGNSAGANLVALMGTSAGIKTLEDLSMGNAEQTSNVQAVVDFYGPINFLTMDVEHEASGMAAKVPDIQKHSPADSAESRYMGAQITTIPEKVKLASPVTYISAKAVPFFIEHGTMDPVVPFQQAVDFAAALENVIGKEKVVFVRLEGAGHGTKEFSTPENLIRVFNFLDKYLK